MEKDNLAFCSWSGGKDAALSLYYAQQQNLDVSMLVTMMIPDNQRSRSHGTREEIFMAQSESLGIPWKKRPSTWENYTEEYFQLIFELDVQYGIFGDIDTESHREWGIDICQRAGMKAMHPIWELERKVLMSRFLSLGFEAYIICVKDGSLDRSFIGKKLDNNLINEITKLPIDLCGEYGEYHTLVTNGPNFSYPLNIDIATPLYKEGMWVSDVTLC